MSGINGGKKKEFHFNCKIKVHLHRYFQKIAFKSFCFLTSFVYIILCLENFLVRFSSRCLLLSVEYKVLQRRVFSFKKLWFKPINIQTYKLLLVVSTLISFCSWLLFLVMYFFFFSPEKTTVQEAAISIPQAFPGEREKSHLNRVRSDKILLQRYWNSRILQENSCMG